MISNFNSHEISYSFHENVRSTQAYLLYMKSIRRRRCRRARTGRPTQATGKQVNLKVVVDPSVLGGIVATVGDTVIDGSVRTRIDQLKSRL